MAMSDFPGEFQDRYRAEYIRSIQEHQPVYVIVGLPYRFMTTAEQTLQDFPELARILETRYRLDFTRGLVQLYRRVD